MLEPLDVQLFNKRVVETVAWCNLLLQSVKEEDLGASLLWSILSQPRKELADYNSQERSEFINEVFISRTRRLKETANDDIFNPEHLMTIYHQGRLLGYFPSLSMLDGLTKTVSDNYLDYGGCPPWDTWIYYLLDDETRPDHSHIIAWVPPQFVEIVNDSIKMSPDDSLVWLATPTFPLPYTDLLGAANLLI